MPILPLLAGLLALAFLGLCSLAVSACTRYDAALLPLPVLCGAVTVLYVTALFNVLHIGLFAVAGGLLAAGVYCGVRAGWRAVRDAAGSPGFWLFVGGRRFCGCCLRPCSRCSPSGTSSRPWGLAPKMVAERARLYVADPVNLTASFTYPATSLLSYLFQFIPAILPNGSALPPSTSWPWPPLRRWLRCRGRAGRTVCCCLPRRRCCRFSSAPRRWAQPARSTATQWRTCRCLPVWRRAVPVPGGGRPPRRFYAVALPLAVLAMTKDIGLAYGLIAVFLIGVDQLFGTQQPEGWRRLRVFGYRLARTALLAVPVLAVFVSWSRYTAAMAPEAGSSTVGSAQMSYGAVLLGGVCQLLGIGREARFAELMQTMAQALVSRRVCLLGRPPWCWGLWPGCRCWRSSAAPKGALRRRVAAGFFASAFCFAALYLFHLILYFYNFSETEAAALKDYERYLMPFLQGWTVAALCQLGQCAAAAPARTLRRRLGAAGVGLAAVGFLAVFAWRGVPTAGFWTRADSLYSVRADVKARAGVMNEVLDWNDRVLVISQGDDATRWYYYKYELTARVINGYGGVWWGDSDYSSRWDSDFMNLSKASAGPCTTIPPSAPRRRSSPIWTRKTAITLCWDRADEYLERDFSAGSRAGSKPTSLPRCTNSSAPTRRSLSCRWPRQKAGWGNEALF